MTAPDTTKPFDSTLPERYLARRKRLRREEQERIDAANEAIVRRAFGGVSAPEHTATALTDRS